MPVANISVTNYNGSLLSVSALTSTQTIVLSAIGSSGTVTLEDDDGTLSTSDDGISTIDGDALTYIGSGTIQPGVDVAGIVIPLGTPKDVVVFEAGGQIYFHYPDGAPNFLSSVVAVLELSTASYPVFTPLCFVRGTLLQTPAGEVPVCELKPGDTVIDVHGAECTVRWVGSMEITVPEGCSACSARPISIAPGALGPGQPSRETRLSPAHRVLVRSPETELLFGESECLAAASALVNGDSIKYDSTCSQVEYFHVMCDDHRILVANGMPAESLAPPEAAISESGAIDESAVAEAAFADLLQDHTFRRVPPPAMVLKGYEARLLAAELH